MKKTIPTQIPSTKQGVGASMARLLNAQESRQVSGGAKGTPSSGSGTPSKGHN